MDFIEIFYSVLGTPDSLDKLIEYIDYCISNKTEEINEIYCENHHILPRSMFPNYINETFNIVRLPYASHIEAHKLLAMAYTIKPFTRPLNNMVPSDDITRNLLSTAQKRWWKELSDEAKKLFGDNISKKKIDRWNSMTDEEQDLIRDHCKQMSLTRHAKEGSAEILSNQMKLQWQDEDYRNYMIQKVIDRYNDPEYYEFFCERMQYRWDNMPEEEREKFRDNMTIVNRDMNKREDAGKKIKAKWQDEEYLKNLEIGKSNSEREQNRRKNMGNIQLKIWADPIKKAERLEKRKKTRKVWWNNGVDEIKSVDAPRENWVRGRKKPSKPPKEKSSPKKVKCPHCDVIGNISPMHRWHFDNCKKRIKDETN